MGVTLDATVARQPQVVAQVVADEAVLLVPARGEVKVLNEVGARIWTLLDGTRTLAEITDVICAEYAAEHAAVAQDTLRFIDDLAARDLIAVQL